MRAEGERPETYRPGRASKLQLRKRGAETDSGATQGDDHADSAKHARLQPPGAVGLVNLGDTCYINVSLKTPEHACVHEQVRRRVHVHMLLRANPSRVCKRSSASAPRMCVCARACVFKA